MKRAILTTIVLLLNPLAWACVVVLAVYSRIDLAARRAGA